MPLSPEVAYEIRKLKQEIADLNQTVQFVRGGGGSNGDEYAHIPGRRIMFNFTQTQTFTTSQDGVRGSQMNFLVSMAGPFIMTCYPLAMWLPTLPTSATNLNRWRPVSSAWLPTQAVTTDFIDLSYEMNDNGPGRNFQDNPAPAGLLSYPGRLEKLEKSMFFEKNTVIGFTPLFNKITFSGSTPPTQGTLYVTLIGYKIVELGN